MKIVRPRKTGKTSVPPLSIVTRSISREKSEMSYDHVNPKTSAVSDSTNASDIPTLGLSPHAALRAIHERNRKVETDNAFLQQQLETIRTLMENDRESRERDKASLDLLRAQIAQ